MSIQTHTITTSTRTFKVTLDSSCIVIDDPGQGTPMLIEITKGEGNGACSTLNCAAGEAEIDGWPLTDGECNALEPIFALSDNWLDRHTAFLTR